MTLARVVRTWTLPLLLTVEMALASAAAAGAGPARSLLSSDSTKSTPSTDAPARAVFAGGCFWCVEAAFEGLPGVRAVVSGYSGGAEERPTYGEVSSGRTGHAESVEITFDPATITYGELLDVFWHNIDPTQGDGQFCDHGTQYRSVIFTIGDAQRREALASKRRIEASGRLRGPIVTAIVPFTRFWPAEEYHQDYYKKNPAHYQAYRLGCGRDARLRAIWGKDAGGHIEAHKPG